MNNENFTTEEKYYYEMISDMLDDGTISDDERRILDKRKTKFGINDERAIEIESIAKTNLKDILNHTNTQKNEKYEDKHTSLLSSVSESDRNSIKELIELGTNVNAENNMKEGIELSGDTNFADDSVFNGDKNSNNQKQPYQTYEKKKKSKSVIISTITSIAVVILIIVVIFSLNKNSIPSGNYELIGFVDEKIPVTMWLNIDSKGNVSGRYYYNKYNINITIEGNTDKNIIYMRGYESRKIIDEFVGTFDKNHISYIGNLTSIGSGKSYSFSFSKK